MNENVLRRHSRRLDELDALLHRVAKDVEDLAGLRSTSETSASSPADADSQGVADPVFASSKQWVEEYLQQVFQRSYGGELRWCSEWEAHPEATLRLEAMWRAWEALQSQERLGLSVWLLSHFDPNFTVLTSRSGPFARCTPERHSA